MVKSDDKYVPMESAFYWSEVDIYVQLRCYLSVYSYREKFKNLKGKSIKKSRDWILEKKERRRRQGR